MNRFLNTFTKNKSLFCNLNRMNKNCLKRLINKNAQNEDDIFGVGSKYANLDSIKSSINHEVHIKSIKTSNAKSFIKTEKVNDINNDPDKFGTLTNQLDDIEFKTSIGYSKPISEYEFSKKKEDPESELYEKKYEKVLDHIRLSNEGDRPNTEIYYGSKINDLANKGKIKEAIDVFFVEMIEKDRYKPTLWLYKTLMRHLAHFGYTHMVFSLFKRITGSHDDNWNETRKSTKLHQIVTILFQACANSPWPEYSIRKCDSIRFYLKNRQITPNLKNYSAMISAYGRAGAIYESFNVVDEMFQNKMKPDLDIFKNLLCACLSQPNYGFRYALLTWQMCLKFKIKPDLQMYNLLLRAANDCNISIKKDRIYLESIKNKETKYLSLNDNKNLFPRNTQEYKLFVDEDYQLLTKNHKIDQISPTVNHKDIKEKILNKEPLNTLETTNSSKDILNLSPNDVHVIDDLKVVGRSLENQIKNLEWWQDIKTNVNKTELLKGLSNFRPELKDAILAKSYKSLLTQVDTSIEKEALEFITIDQDTREGRLSMLGGLEGIFKSMNFHQVSPDFKTFNIIIQLIPNNIEAENDLLAKMKNYNLKPDIDFINFLIKRRIIRKEYYDANLAFKMIQDYQLSPNIITFGCLANKIDKFSLLTEFLNDLKNMNLKLNPIIISTLYTKGRFKKDIRFLNYLFDYILENKIKIDKKLKNKIDHDIEIMKKDLILMEKKQDLTKQEEIEYQKLRNFYKSFNEMYHEWLGIVKIDVQQHPYAKFERKNDKYFDEFLKMTEKLKLNQKD